MHLSKLILAVLFSFSISMEALTDNSQNGALNIELSTLNKDGIAAHSKTTLSIAQVSLSEKSKAPLKPYPRLLPLRLQLPSIANVGMPIEGVSVNLRNPGGSAPNARLRLLIHDSVHRKFGTASALSPKNVKLELFERGVWKPVELGVVEGGLMGAIGREGLKEHRERYHRGGFSIPRGLDKTWQLRLTIDLAGSYTLVAAVSPDNGSRHIANPVHAVIDVQ